MQASRLLKPHKMSLYRLYGNIMTRGKLSQHGDIGSQILTADFAATTKDHSHSAGDFKII